MKYRATIVAFGVGLLAAIMAGCSTPSAHASYPNDAYFDEMHKQLSDGRLITCLEEHSGNGYALSCDWMHPK